MCHGGHPGIDLAHARWAKARLFSPARNKDERQSRGTFTTFPPAMTRP